MINLQKEYEKMFSQLDEHSRVCIWGCNSIAEEIYDKLKFLRPDVEVKFFVDSQKQGTLKSVPLYLVKDLSKYIDSIDAGIIASYSSRFYMDFILKSFGIKNNVMITKNILDIKAPKIKKPQFNIEKSAKIFKTHKERELYRFLAKARKNRYKYAYAVRKWYDKHHAERILEYSTEHYYEFTNNNAIEVVIDAGGYDGMHSLLSLQKFPNCKNVYTFEPCYDSFKTDLFDNLIKSKPEIEIVKKALWKENTTIQFREEFDIKTGSSVVEAKPNIKRPSRIIDVEAITLDAFIESKHPERVDFIKMDLENAELEALAGAEKTILKYRPQLAISIYHSDEQFYNIPLYLNKLLTNYEFRLGHYSNAYTETLLYAIPKELTKK